MAQKITRGAISISGLKCNIIPALFNIETRSVLIADGNLRKGTLGEATSSR